MADTTITPARFNQVAIFADLAGVVDTAVTPTGLLSVIVFGIPGPGQGVPWHLEDGSIWQLEDGTVWELQGLVSDATPEALISTAIFSTPTITVGAGATLTPAALVSVAVFGSIAIEAGTGIAVLPSALTSVAVFGSPTVVGGVGATPAPTRLVSTATFGTPALDIGAGAAPAPTQLVSVASFGTPAIEIGHPEEVVLLAQLVSYARFAVGAALYVGLLRHSARTEGDDTFAVIVGST